MQSLKGDHRGTFGRKSSGRRGGPEGGRLVFLAGPLLGGALGMAFDGALTALAGAALGVVLAQKTVVKLRMDRLLRLRSELEVVLSAISVCVRSGLSIPQALEMSIGESGRILGPELEICLKEYQVGIPLPEALSRSGRRIGCSGLEDLSLLLELHGRYGGNLAGSLSGLAESLRRERMVQADLLAKTAESRNSASVLALLPVLLAFYLVKYQTDLVEPLWTEPLGQASLATAAGLWAVGSWLASGLLSSDDLHL